MTFVLVVTLTQISFHKSPLFLYHNKITCFGWDPGYNQLNCGCHKVIHKTACVLISKWMPTVKLTVMSYCAFKLTFYWTLTHKIFISFPGNFRQYEYGLANLYKYGKLNPPDYNLSIISSFVSLIVGPNDWLASPEVRKKPVWNVFLCTLIYVTLTWLFVLTIKTNYCTRSNNWNVQTKNKYLSAVPYKRKWPWIRTKGRSPLTLSWIYDNIVEHSWKYSDLSASTRELLRAVLEDTNNVHPVYINYCT